MGFSRSDLIKLLDELAKKLNELEIKGSLRIIGGAAIALEYAERPPTNDIDAEFISPNTSQVELREVVEGIAHVEGIPYDWLNDYAKVFMPRNTEDDWLAFQISGEITIFVASAPLLLAMKPRATRGIRDAEDILALLGICGISSLEDIKLIYARYYNSEPLTDKAITLIRKYLTGKLI